MWSAWLNLKTYHRPPSDDLELTDSIAAYCVNGAVLWFGTKIENMLSERVNHGSEKEPKWEDKYTLSQLLDANYHPDKPLPPLKTKRVQGGFDALMAMAAQSSNGIKRWEYVKPS